MTQIRLTGTAGALPRLALTVALACATLPAWPLDLKQAFEAALEQDANILASRAAAASGRERLPQARAQLLPNLSFSAGRNKNDLTSTAPNFFGQEQTTQNNYFSGNRALTLRLPLIRPASWAQYRQAEAQAEEADATLERDLQNLAVRVGGAYFETLLADDQLDLVLAQKTTYTTQLDAARKALAAGSGTRTDIDDAQARLDMAVAQELEARQQQDYTRRQLQALVNQPIERLAPLDVERLQLQPPVPARVEDWVERAEQDSPEIQALKAQLEGARQEVAKAQTGHYPTLDATAQWSRSDSENVLNIRSSYYNKAVGVQLSVPIFAGGYFNSTVRQALAEQERIEQSLEAQRRQLGVRVHKEFRGVNEGVLRVRALEQAARSATQVVLSTRKSFAAGGRTQLDILNAEQQRMLALRDLAQARYVYLISRLRLQALAGGDRHAAIAEINAWLQP